MPLNSFNHSVFCNPRRGSKLEFNYLHLIAQGRKLFDIYWDLAKTSNQIVASLAEITQFRISRQTLFFIMFLGLLVQPNKTLGICKLFKYRIHGEIIFDATFYGFDYFGFCKMRKYLNSAPLGKHQN